MWNPIRIRMLPSWTFSFTAGLVSADRRTAFSGKNTCQPLQAVLPSVRSLSDLAACPGSGLLLEKGAEKPTELCLCTRPAGYEFQVRSLLSEVILELRLHLSWPGCRPPRTVGRQEKERVKEDAPVPASRTISARSPLAELSAQANICERECSPEL